MVSKPLTDEELAPILMWVCTKCGTCLQNAESPETRTKICPNCPYMMIAQYDVSWMHRRIDALVAQAVVDEQRFVKWMDRAVVAEARCERYRAMLDDMDDIWDRIAALWEPEDQLTEPLTDEEMDSIRNELREKSLVDHAKHLRRLFDGAFATLTEPEDK